MPRGIPIPFYQLKKQMLERKFKDIMPSYLERASEIRPSLPHYSDEVLNQKLEDVVFKLKVIRAATHQAQTKDELHRLRKMLDYSLGVKRFIRIEIKKREVLQHQAEDENEVEIVEVINVDEQSSTIEEDRKPTREEFEEMEREDLRQIGLNLSFSNIHINDLAPVVVPDLPMEFMDRPALFDPEIVFNNIQTIYDHGDHDMHFLDILYSVDDSYEDPIASIESRSEKEPSASDVSSSEPPTISLICEEPPEEPLARENAYSDGLIDYTLAIDIRTGNPFRSNKGGERLYISNDGNFYGIDPYDYARELKVKQKKYVCFGYDDLDRKQDRIYLSCIEGMNPYGYN